MYGELCTIIREETIKKLRSGRRCATWRTISVLVRSSSRPYEFANYETAFNMCRISLNYDTINVTRLLAQFAFSIRLFNSDENARSIDGRNSINDLA